MIRCTGLKSRSKCQINLYKYNPFPRIALFVHPSVRDEISAASAVGKASYIVNMYDACVPWPERPKGAKDKVKMPEGQKAGPKGCQLEVGA